MEPSDLVKKHSENSLNQSTQNQQIKNSSQKNISDSLQGNTLKNLAQNQNTSNLNQSQNQTTPNQNSTNNILNTSANYSFHESQSSLQNPSLINPQGSGNFPSKEYFNFQFFKRQLSSQSSDIDFGTDNKEGLNDFFAARFNSVLSKDSSKPKSNNIKKSVDRISCDFEEGREYLSTENKDEQTQFFSARANSGCLNKCHNYIPKTFYFRRNNSNTPSCFFNKNNNNNLNKSNNNEQNLVLKYYGNNNEYNLRNNNNMNKNKYLDVVNDKDDENEEDGDDSDSDDCILSKEDNKFSMNYISRKLTQNLTLPKRTFTLIHRRSSQILNNERN